MNFYEFIDPQFGHSEICIGPNDAVCRVFDERSFVKTFGGYLLYQDKQTKQIYIGIWRKRRASKFRRLMRAGGFEFNVLREMPSTLVSGAKNAWVSVEVKKS